MKYFLLIVALLFSTLSKAQDSIDSTKVTFGRVYSDIKEGIQGLSSALKVGAEHVYEVLVRQQIVYSVTNLIVYLLIGALLIYLWKIIIKKIQTASGNGTDLEDEEGLLVLFNVPASLGFMIYFFITITDTFTGLLNPEYGAIKDIINFVK